MVLETVIRPSNIVVRRLLLKGMLSPVPNILKTIKHVNAPEVQSVHTGISIVSLVIVMIIA